MRAPSLHSSPLSAECQDTVIPFQQLQPKIIIIDSQLALRYVYFNVQNKNK